MILSLKERIKIFIIGLLIGCGIVAYIFKQKQYGRKDYKEPETVAEMEAEVVPKIFQAYRERRVPMESKFIRSCWQGAIFSRGDSKQTTRAEKLRKITDMVLPK